MDHRRAHAAADAHALAARDQFRRMAQRPGDILDGLAGLQRHQFPRALAHGLDDQRDGAGGRIGIGDGQRDAFRARPAADDDKLPGPADFRDARRDDSRPNDIRRQ